MNNKPIGIFDSGLGGLTAVKELMSILPKEDLIYFGDTGRVPYGSRSEETILKYTKQDIRFLLSYDIKAILAACGTVSSVALPHLKGSIGVPVVGVVDAAAQEAAAVTQNGKIGVLGTPGTIKSGSYERAVHQLCGEAEVFSIPCPLFVHLVENGHTASKAAYLIAEEYLKPLLPHKVDTVILGCTHYPLLTGIIQNILGDGVRLINVGKAAAKKMRSLLAEKEMLAEREKGNCSFYVSDSADGFTSLAETFLGRKIDRIERIDLEQIQEG